MKALGAATLADTVARLQWSPDGTSLVAASLAGDVVVLSPEGLTRWSPQAHPGGALSAAFSPDGTHLATGGQDGRVRVYTPRDHALVATVDARGPWVAEVAWQGDGALLATAAGRVVRFFTPDGHPRGEAIEHASTVTSLHWHPVCGWSSACYGGVQFLRPDARQAVRRLPFRGSILVARPDPEGVRMAAGNQDASVRYWDLHGRNDTSLTGYPGKVRVLAWSAVGPLLATGGGSDVVAWPCADRGPLGRLPQKACRHTARVSALAFTRDGRTLVSAGEDGRICLWAYDPAEGFTCTAEADAGAPVTALALEPDTGRVAVALRGGGVTVWETVASPAGLTGAG